MKWKKTLIVACCVMIAALGIALTGCGKSNDGSGEKYADSPYVGTWMVGHYEYEGKEYPYPGLLEFTFHADGTSSLEDVSDTVEGKWEPTEEGLKFGDAQDEYNIIYEDEKLKMEMEHEKGTVMVYFYKYK